MLCAQPFPCTSSIAPIYHTPSLLLPPLPFQISGREDKHRKEFIISSINHHHQSLLAFWPHKTTKPAQAPVTALEGSAGVATGTGAVTATTTVEEVFKPSLHVSPLFEAIRLDPHAFYSPSAVHNTDLSYISLHSLTNPSDLSIGILDATLCDALYEGAIKKGLPYPTECPKRDGSRKVIRVTGVKAYLVEAELLAAELRKKFASSTSVAQVPGGFSCNRCRCRCGSSTRCQVGSAATGAGAVAAPGAGAVAAPGAKWVQLHQVQVQVR
ncbi:unnamed protein product [Closterium sp. NIES-64]|nr:unnamed protein product [Closterium sp. NIES-64]